MKNSLYQQCRFYNGEDKAPDWMNQNEKWFWGYESYWFHVHMQGESCPDYLLDYPSMKGFEVDDGTPQDLKALLCDRYCHFGGSVRDFKKYYKQYYQVRMTNKERMEQREKERRPILIEKCRYYKGEDTNPWELCYSPVLVYRKNLWDIEKEWVDAMVESYNCPQSSKELIKSFALIEFFKTKDIALSLLNLIVTKEKEKADADKVYFGPAESIKVYEKYAKLAPLDRDYKKYYAFYLGEEEFPYHYDDVDEYWRMGWYQERLVLNGLNSICNFDSKDFQRECRGKEGIWGWYADPKFPKEQKDLLFFIISNWGTWCPYCDEDKLAEEYLNYHYPGDNKYQKTDKFYHNAALQHIKEETKYYRTVHKRGVYQGKRVYVPIFKDEFKENSPCLGFPLVILVDDEGQAESIRSFESLDILKEVRKKKSETK